MQRLPITIVMPSATQTGGAEEALLQLVKSEVALSALKTQLIFLEDGDLKYRCEQYVDHVLTVKCVRTRQVVRWWRASRTIGRHAVNFGSRLIVGWMTKGHVYGGLAAWLSRLPAAWYQMGLPENASLDRMSRLLPARFVMTCSDFVRERQRQRQPGARIVAVPLGVDLQRFNLENLPTVEECKRDLQIPADCPVVGIVGRLQAWKGMHVLLRAMPEVLSRFPQAKCVVVGGTYPAEPGYGAELRSIAEESGIRSSIIFAGAQANVPKWVQALDVFVHASKEEPFGIVVIEALALGKKVIATAPGGPEEIIKNGENGWITSFGDSSQLASRIIEAITLNKNCEDRITSNAIGTAAQFSSNVYAARFINAIHRHL